MNINCHRCGGGGVVWKDAPFRQSEIEKCPDCKLAGPMELWGIDSETPETNALHIKQGLSHAEYRKHAQKLERERNEIRVRAEYEFNLRKRYENVTEKALSLVKFWEEQGGGNGVMARAKEDALILACGSLRNAGGMARELAAQDSESPNDING